MVVIMNDRKKRVLLYNWGSVSQPDLLQSLRERSDVEVTEISHPLTDYDRDDIFAGMLEERNREKPYQICMSFNYFPFLSRACQELNLLYISWIYDSPHTTLHSETRHNDCNLIFCFDRKQAEKLRQDGHTHAFHLPLAANTDRLDALCAPVPKRAPWLKGLADSVSFVGSLYDNNFFEQINYLPPQIKGYLEGICRAQAFVYGESLLENLLDDSILAEVKKYVSISIDNGYDMTYREMFLDSFLRKYIAAQERKFVLTALGQSHPVILYSGSSWTSDGVENRGIVEYQTQMPLVFRSSALNLNLAIRSIPSGIPMRCIDILGARGLLFSNPQEELLEYFTPDVDFITFWSREEMLDKAAFFLPREDARKKIAQNGYRKLKRSFTYRHALNYIFETANRYL